MGSEMCIRDSVYVVPMRSKSEVPNAVKQFAREVRAPQTSDCLKKFCQSIGTSLRVLDEGTPWSILAELYIGITKDSVRNNMNTPAHPYLFGIIVWNDEHVYTALLLRTCLGSWKQSTYRGDERNSNLCHFGFIGGVIVKI